MTQLDHIMYACPDLQAGIDEIYALTGNACPAALSYPESWYP